MGSNGIESGIELADIVESPMTDRELLEEIYRMVSEMHDTFTEVAPSLAKVSQDIQKGGIMGLLSGMMTSRG